MKTYFKNIGEDLSEKWEGLEPVTKVSLVFGGILTVPFLCGASCLFSVVLNWIF